MSVLLHTYIHTYIAGIISYVCMYDLTFITCGIGSLPYTRGTSSAVYGNRVMIEFKHPTTVDPQPPILEDVCVDARDT